MLHPSDPTIQKPASTSQSSISGDNSCLIEPPRRQQPPQDRHHHIMRLLNGLALAGLAGLSVGATPEPAEVYILSSTPYRYSSSSSHPTLQLPRQLVRDILFQRVTDGSHLSSVVDDDKVLSHISKYGGTPKPLFGEESENVAPSQLVVLLEGITEKNAKLLKDQIQQKGHDIAFEISDAPSRKANQHLVDIEFAAMGVSGSCDVAAAVNPYDSCWNGMSLVVKYDVNKVCSAHYLPTRIARGMRAKPLTASRDPRVPRRRVPLPLQVHRLWYPRSNPGLPPRVHPLLETRLLDQCHPRRPPTSTPRGNPHHRHQDRPQEDRQRDRQGRHVPGHFPR